MRFATKQQREISAIRSAVHNLESGTLPTVRHRAIQSIAVARAVHNTLLAKRKLAYERLNEAKLQLQVSHDGVEDVQNHVALSEQQVGRIVQQMNAQGIYSTVMTAMDNSDDDVDIDVDDGVSEISMDRWSPRRHARAPWSTNSISEHSGTGSRKR